MVTTLLQTLKRTRSDTAAQDAPCVLIVTDRPWWLHSLESVCDSAGFVTLHANSFRSATDLCRLGAVDAVLVLAPHLDTNLADGCRMLRALPTVDAHTPVLLVVETTPTRDQRLAALEAGYWEYFAFPVDAEILILKLRLLTAARQRIDRMHQEALLDQQTGLYTQGGLQRRLAELGAVARRYRRPLSCVVLTAADAPARGAGVRLDGRLDAVLPVVSSYVRSSDVVGQLSASELVIVAPETEPNGVVRLAERLIEGGRAVATDQPLLIHAGCSGSSDLDLDHVEPAELVLRATMALRRLQSTPVDGRGRVALYQDA